MWRQRLRGRGEWGGRSPGAYRGRARLQVGGAVPDHHHRLEAVLLLQKADHLAFAATLGRGLMLVEAGILAWKIKGGVGDRDQQGSGSPEEARRRGGAARSPLK